MKQAKIPYTSPCLSITDFEPADLLLLSEGSDGNEGIWRPTVHSLNLDIFNKK